MEENPNSGPSLADFIIRVKDAKRNATTGANLEITIKNLRILDGEVSTAKERFFAVVGENETTPDPQAISEACNVFKKASSEFEHALSGLVKSIV